jgi:hypothetical protein
MSSKKFAYLDFRETKRSAKKNAMAAIAAANVNSISVAVSKFIPPVENTSYRIVNTTVKIIPTI